MIPSTFRRNEAVWAVAPDDGPAFRSARIAFPRRPQVYRPFANTIIAGLSSRKLVEIVFAPLHVAIMAPFISALYSLASPRPHHQPGTFADRCQGSGVGVVPSVWIILYPFPTYIMDHSAAPNKPVKVFRLHGLSASIFANRAKSADREVPFYKVSLQRTYHDGEKFQSTTSLGRDDLPIAGLLLEKAWVFILETEQVERKDTGAEQ